VTKQEFHARVWAKLLAYNRKLALVEPGDRILIAVSGGPDSVCLAHFLSQLSRKMRLRLHIAHLHHGLRGKEADRDARLVLDLAESLDIPIDAVRIPVAAFAEESGRSLEEAGRVMRYGALGRLAAKEGCNKIATGHQTDDVAETFILNLMRGTKAEGLAGIPPKRLLWGAGRRIEVIRPLLCLSRREVLSYLKYSRLPFATDRSNLSRRFTRNWVRLKVLPLLEKKNPEVRAHIAAIAEDFRQRYSMRTSRRTTGSRGRS